MRAGEIIDGRFELLKRAGSGGMGVVWRALDGVTGRPVALKVLQDPEGGGASRFLHEGRILSGLEHPHIVRYVMHGIATTGEPYLAMEWVEGESLAARLLRSGLSLSTCLELVRRVASALATAHARGVVHRDIKPNNLLLSEGDPEQVKVLDFGIARRSGDSFASTATGAIVGTLGYMAPEQARGERALGPPADVFSLGCVLFECVAGKPAFHGAHPVALLAKLLLEEPPRLRDLRPEAPEALAALLGRMLAKDPAQRPPDGAAVLSLLDEIAVDSREALSRRPCSERSAITGTERRLVSIVAVASSCGSPPGRVGAHVTPRERLIAVRRAALPLGARVEELSSGVVLAVLVGEGSVTDQAANAARCALAVKTSAPAETVVLVTGHAEATNELPVGEALERAAALLDQTASGPLALVRIDEVTRALLDPRFDIIEEQGRLLLCAERRSGEEIRTLLGKPSPFLGRERELRNVLDLLAESFEERRPVSILVTAPPGMGKSRLRQEVVRALQQERQDLSLALARPDAIGAGASFAILGEALRDLLQISGCDSLDARRKKIASLADLPRDDDGPWIIEFLGELASAPFPDDDSPRLRAARQNPQLMADRIEAAFVALVASLSERRPVLVVLEDLHWGDAPSLKILDAALRDLGDRPLAVLAFARPEVHERFPRLWTGRNVHEVRLAPLPRRAATDLVQSALGDWAGADATSALVERAGGNAFYLEELIRAVAEGRGEALPDTVLGMVEARIAALPPGSRRLLRAASVFGEVFTRNGVHHLLGGDPSLTASLAELCEGELLVRRQKARFAGEEEIAFRHALLREGAYAMLTEPDRKLGHRLAGEWLEGAGEQDALVLAEHFQRGGDAERAAAYYLRAGVKDFDRDDLQGALARAQRGIDCGVQGEILGNLLSLATMAHCWRTELEAAHRTSRAALPLVARGGRWECIVLFHGTWASLVTGAEDDFVDLAGRFVLFDPRPEARRDYLLWAPLAASLLTSYGYRELCRALLDRAEALSTTLPSLDLDLLGALLIGRSDHVRAFERAPFRQYTWTCQAVEAFAQIGDLRNQVTALNRLGQAESELGDLAAGESTLRRAVALAQRIRGPFAQRQSELHLGALLCKSVDETKWSEAESIARAVLAAPGIGTGYRGWAHGIRAQILLHRGSCDEAIREAREADAACTRVPLRRLWVRTLLIRALLQRGDREEALVLARGLAVELERLGGGGYVEIEARLSITEAMQANGEVEGARALLAETMRQIEVRAASIPEPAWAARYRERVPENARARALARAWLS
jgi:hypothetical protein